MKPIHRTSVLAILLLLLGSGAGLLAQDTSDHVHNAESPLMSPYVDEESRTIATLSDEDIQQLENGEGWGLARAAELNGVPGPAHLLEMVEQDAIHLTSEQLTRVKDLYDTMKGRAIPVGKRLIELERELNRKFSTDDMTAADLEELLGQIASTTAALRYIHLSTHLETLPILNTHQIEMYNRLRGYSLSASAPGQ